MHVPWWSYMPPCSCTLHMSKKSYRFAMRGKAVRELKQPLLSVTAESSQYHSMLSSYLRLYVKVYKLWTCGLRIYQQQVDLCPVPHETWGCTSVLALLMMVLATGHPTHSLYCLQVALHLQIEIWTGLLNRQSKSYFRLHLQYDATRRWPSAFGMNALIEIMTKSAKPHTPQIVRVRHELRGITCEKWGHLRQWHSILSVALFSHN